MPEALSGTIDQYVGKKADYLIFDGLREAGDTLLTQSLALPRQSGASVVGVQKLVQRFLLELLTDRGSIPYRPTRGTFFTIRFRSGAIRTSQELFSEFVSAELFIRTALSLEETAADPPDERYGEARLLSAELFADTAALSIQITSRAGNSRQVIYPLRSTTP